MTNTTARSKIMAKANNIIWAEAFRTNTELDAEMFKHNLESAGIEVRILSQVDSTRYFTLGMLAVVKIYVPLEALQLAKSIITDIESSENAFENQIIED